MRHHRSIAVAQTCPARGDVDTNLDQHLRLARVAAAAGARVVLFPELSLTGYEMDLAAELAFTAGDPRLEPLTRAATSHALTLVIGAPVRLTSGLHIGALIIPPDRPATIYTKHRLGAFGEHARCDGTVPPAESTVFNPGTLNPPVALGTSHAALAICADVGDPAHVERAAAAGAGTCLASMFLIPSEYEADATRLAAYSARHGMVVALANFGGPTGGLAAAGRSAIWSAAGDVLVQLGPSGAGVAVAIETTGGWRTHRVMEG